MNLSTDQHWSSIYEKGRDFRLVTSQEIDRFLSHANPATPKSCLDLGCDTGQLTRELYHRGYQAVGIDASIAAVRRAQELTTVSAEKLSYIQADLEYDDLKDTAKSLAPYGLVTCKLVYAFIEDKAAFLENVNSMLHPKGTFVVITPMVEDVDETKKGIAVDDAALHLLELYFIKAEVYKLNGLVYFIGKYR